MNFIYSLCIIICLLSFFIAIWLLRKVYLSRKIFIKKAKSIHNGMTKTDVISLMGKPTSWEYEADKEILIWEKVNMVEHIGVINFGVKVIIKDGVVTATSHKNLDKSMYW